MILFSITLSVDDNIADEDVVVDKAIELAEALVMLKTYAARRTVVRVNNGFAIILNSEYNGSMDMCSGKICQF